MIWAGAVFIGILILVATMKILVIDSAVMPLIEHAESMPWSSTHSREGLSALRDWVGFFTIIGAFCAVAFFVSYSYLVGRGRV